MARAQGVLMCGGLMFARQLIFTGLFLAISVIHASAQDQPMPPMPGMPGMDHGDAPPATGNMNMIEMNPAGMYLMNLASGTSSNPASWPMPMVMAHFGSWNTMFMGSGFLVETQQSGPRGGDKLYSPNWFMAAAGHRVGAKGAFELN